MWRVYPIKMFSRINFLKIFYIYFFIFSLAVSSSPIVFAQNLESPLFGDKKAIYAVLKDERGEIIEGLLKSGLEEILVQTKDNQEKLIPIKYIKSITLEKTKNLLPEEASKREATYTVRLENSQEIYTLKKKYTFSLNTNLGLVTKTIDPEIINKIFNKDQASLKSEDEKPFLQEKSIVFSLEFKF